jgi:hypothetical protein
MNGGQHALIASCEAREEGLETGGQTGQESRSPGR